jgi:hypothetical protein
MNLIFLEKFTIFSEKFYFIFIPDPDPDPANSFGSGRILVYNTALYLT